MTITIKLATTNAAFTDNPTELRDILTAVTYAICAGSQTFPIRDSNGNTVGRVTVKGK